ncbi:MAG: septation protein SpoVG family protein [Candidatus Omnitrophota bacterium]|jgi:stage V sporulation protein G
MLSFSVKRLYRFDGDGPLKAIADVSIGEEFMVKGFRVVEGKKGIFVSGPQQPGNDGKWYPTAYPMNEEVKKELDKMILEAFGEPEGRAE